MANVGVAPTPNRRTHILVGTSRGGFRSDDGGNTFVPVQNGFRGAPVNDLAFDTEGRLMIAALNMVVVFRAQRAGRPHSYDNFGARITTTQTDLVGTWSGSAIAPSSVDANVTVAATVFNGVFSTADGGATWTKATITPDTRFNFFTRATFAPGSASRIYL